jgi:hypothetical protein
MLKAKPGETPQPNKSLAQRVMKRLDDNGLVKKNGRSFTLTILGTETAKKPAATAI